MTKPIGWELYRSFLAVLAEGSLSGAARALDITQPTVGRHIAALERALVTAPTLVLDSDTPLLTHAELASVGGDVGDFEVAYTEKPRLVDPDRCTLCDRCTQVCPIEVDREFGAGLERRKAIHLPFAQAIPRSYVIDEATCTRCGACAEACPTDAVNLSAQPTGGSLNVGAIILGFGFEPFRRNVGDGNQVNIRHLQVTRDMKPSHHARADESYL